MLGQRVGDCIACSVALISMAASPVPADDPATVTSHAPSVAEVSGRIEDLQTAADLIAFNQNNHVGLSIPGEGRIERSTGIISRWELPIPVHVDSSIRGTNVAEALDYWKSVAGLSFTLVEADAK